MESVFYPVLDRIISSFIPKSQNGILSDLLENSEIASQVCDYLGRLQDLHLSVAIEIFITFPVKNIKNTY